MQQMEAGKINSILKRKDAIEKSLIDSEEQLTLEQAKEKIMPKVLEQYEEFKKNQAFFAKAKELVDTYGNSNLIPEEELSLEKSGYDEARLLAACEILEKEKMESKLSH